MDGTDPTGTSRKRIKALLKPELHEQLLAYADANHRSVSSAAEHLIAVGLSTVAPAPTPAADTAR